jgi:hypothetical protein
MTGMSEFSILEKPTVGKWGEDFFHTDRPARSQGLQDSESGQDYRVDLLKRSCDKKRHYPNLPKQSLEGLTLHTVSSSEEFTHPRFKGSPVIQGYANGFEVWIVNNGQPDVFPSVMAGIWPKHVVKKDLNARLWAKSYELPGQLC